MDQYATLRLRIGGDDGWYVDTVDVQLEGENTVTFNCDFDLDHGDTRTCSL